MLIALNDKIPDAKTGKQLWKRNKWKGGIKRTKQNGLNIRQSNQKWARIECAHLMCWQLAVGIATTISSSELWAAKWWLEWEWRTNQNAIANGERGRERGGSWRRSDEEEGENKEE